MVAGINNVVGGAVTGDGSRGVDEWRLDTLLTAARKWVIHFWRSLASGAAHQIDYIIIWEAQVNVLQT